MEGTRRWLPGTDHREVERAFIGLVEEVARSSGTKAKIDYRLIRDAFYLESNDPLVSAFQASYRGLSGKEPLRFRCHPQVIRLTLRPAGSVS